MKDSLIWVLTIIGIIVAGAFFIGTGGKLGIFKKLLYKSQKAQKDIKKRKLEKKVDAFNDKIKAERAKAKEFKKDINRLAKTSDDTAEEVKVLEEKIKASDDVIKELKKQHTAVKKDVKNADKDISKLADAFSDVL